MNIRPMNKGDAGAVRVLGVGQKEFSTASGSFWTHEQLEKWCESRTDVLLVAEDDGKIIGFSLYATHIPTGKVTWENLYVDPSARGKDVGKSLIQEAHRLLKEKGYSYVVLQNNSNDQERFSKYLEPFGFRPGERVLWMDQFLD